MIEMDNEASQTFSLGENNNLLERLIIDGKQILTVDWW